MNGRRIVFADGEVIETAAAGYADGFLWLTLPGVTPRDAAAKCTDESKTKRILFQYGEMQDEYIGFTVFVSMIAGDDIKVCMTKGE